MRGEYHIEWMDTSGSYSREELEKRVRDVAEEFDAEDEITVGQVKRNSFDPATAATTALVIVNSASLLVKFYKYIRDDEDAQTGVIGEVQGKMIFAERIEQDVIEKHGGTHIENVEGDLNLFTFPTDVGEIAELKSELREREEDGETEDD